MWANPFDFHQSPRTPLYGAAGLALFAVAMIGMVRMQGGPVPQVPVESTAVASRDLLFEDRADGAIVIRDAGAVGRPVVAELAPGTNGFTRSALRGLARERRITDAAGPEVPFRVTRWAEGRLTLTDLATGRSVDLLAFGHTQVEAFQGLLDATGAGGSGR